jgi:hypothetical protein
MEVVAIIGIIFVAALVVLGPTLFMRLQRPMDEIYVILLTKIYQKHK